MQRKTVDLAVTIGVGIFAAANSYNHVYSVARNAGQDKLSSALLWFTVDGLILVGIRNMRRTKLGHVALWAGVAATMAAQVLCGLHGGVGGVIVSVWPAGAFLLCAEIATHRSAPEPAPESTPETLPAPAPRSVPEPKRERPQKRSPERELAVVFAEELRQGATISKRAVKDRMGVGWDRAVELHAQLPALAPA